MDQALLCWKKIGREFSPHIVIFGFCAENVNRNVNLIRWINNPRTVYLFSKPRYILEENELKLINVPTPSLEQLITIMENIAMWDLSKYEHFLNFRDYQEKLWLRSKLISFILYCYARGYKLVFPKKTCDVFYINGESAQLTLKIIREFKKDVESNGATFFIVYLPWLMDLKLLSYGVRLPHSDLLGRIEEFTQVIHPENNLLNKARVSTFKSIFHDHYTAEANRIVAEVIAEYLLRKERTILETGKILTSTNGRDK